MNSSLFLQTLHRTPSWVFLVFFALVVLGYQQSRDRTVGRGRLLLLPLAMLGFSLYGVASSFGVTSLPLSAWSLGFLAIFTFARARRGPKALGITGSGKTVSFHIRGSWTPFALMMIIFFLKYATGYAIARHLSVAYSNWFIGVVSLLLGLVAGLFAVRTAAVWLAASQVYSDFQPGGNVRSEEQ